MIEIKYFKVGAVKCSDVNLKLQTGALGIFRIQNVEQM
jgi:hypothetical protein